jgi:serralysin
MNPKPLAKHLFALSRYLIRGLTLIVALALCDRAQAAFHIWNIAQVYSNSSGTLQFIEMFTTAGGQQFVNGQSITVNNTANTLHNMFNIPSSPNYSSIDSANHFLLFGTAGLQAAGGPAPDFIIPNGFLFTAGGSINFFGTSGTTNGLSYPALPTDGIHALTYNNGPQVVNSPRNYSGQTGQVVPEPAAITLAAVGGICASCFLRRRRS